MKSDCRQKNILLLPIQKWQFLGRFAAGIFSRSFFVEINDENKDKNTKKL